MSDLLVSVTCQIFATSLLLSSRCLKKEPLDPIFKVRAATLENGP